VIEGIHEGLVFRDNLFRLSNPPARAGFLIDAATVGLTVAGNRLVNVGPLVVDRPADAAATASAP